MYQFFSLFPSSQNGLKTPAKLWKKATSMSLLLSFLLLIQAATAALQAAPTLSGTYADSFAGTGYGRSNGSLS